jgi:hypothetical protein
MSEFESGWHAHPEGSERQTNHLPVRRRRVVGLGAICDLREVKSNPPNAVSFSVAEFAVLEDGERVVLHRDRGFTLGLRTTGSALRPGMNASFGETVESITRDVLNVVLPDDEDDEEDHPWEWLAQLARERGLDVSADDLRGLPYEVVLSDNVIRFLASG